MSLLPSQGVFRNYGRSKGASLLPLHYLGLDRGKQTTPQYKEQLTSRNLTQLYFKEP